MKFTKKEFTRSLNFFKDFKDKDQKIELQIKEGSILMKAVKEGNVLILKNVKTDEKDTEKITIAKSWLDNINKQSVDEKIIIDLKINKKTMTTKVNNINFKTNLLTNTEFEFEENQDINGIELVLTRDMLDSINEALKYTETNMKRPILNGVNLTLKNKKLHITGTDAYKAYQVSFDAKTDKTTSITLPRATVEILLSLSANTKEVPVNVTETNFYIAGKGVYLKSTLLSGVYPDINSIIERAKSSKTIDTYLISEEDLKKLKSIRDRSYAFVHITGEKENIYFKTGSKEVTTELIVDHTDGNEFYIAVDYDNLITALDIHKEMTIKKDLILITKEAMSILTLAVRINEEN